MGGIFSGKTLSKRIVMNITDVREVMKEKSEIIFSMDQEASVAEAVEQMVEHEIGALIITDNSLPVGVVTERDIMKCWVSIGYGSVSEKGKRLFKDIKAREVMTSNLIVVEPSDDVNYVINIMVKNRIRHLPVVENKRLIGVLSIRDLAKTCMTSLQAENHYLKEYITDKYPG
jgi:CBS domain-containing protein